MFIWRAQGLFGMLATATALLLLILPSATAVSRQQLAHAHYRHPHHEIHRPTILKQPPPPSLTRPPRIYLHIGPSKTGTTYIQEVLVQLRPELQRHHICWPGLPRYYAFINLAKQLDESAVADKYKKQIDDCLFKQRDVIISSEFFSFMRSYQHVKAFFKGYEVIVIAYHREYISYAYSQYTQHNKLTIHPLSFGDFLMRYLGYDSSSTKAASSRDVLRTFQAFFGANRLVLVDYDGAIAAHRDIAHVLICDIMGALCSESDWNALNLTMRANAAPNMIPYHILQIVSAFVHALGCSLCAHHGEGHSTRTLVSRYQNLSIPLPVVTTNLIGLHATSEQESLSFREEFGKYMLYNDHAASMTVMQSFMALDIDQKAFYADPDCMRWLRAEVVALYLNKKLCSCDPQSRLAIEGLVRSVMEKPAHAHGAVVNATQQHHVEQDVKEEQTSNNVTLLAIQL